MPIYIKERHAPEAASRRTSPILHFIKFLSIILLLIAIVHFFIVTRMDQSAPRVDTCLALIRNTDYTTFVGLQPATQQMAAVQFVDQLAGGAPAALVSVTNSNDQASLDVYVYGCSMQDGTPVLTLLLKRHGLIQGTVDVSDAGTLLIGERDPTITQADSVLLQPLQQNVYQEYAWQGGSFVQVPFPGLYPVTNRSGASTLQTEASGGQQLPWSDPVATAEQMARDILHWTRSDPGDTQLDNDGTTAHVLLVHAQPTLQLKVTLKRLMQHGSSGLWFVTAASTPGITLDQSHWRYPLTSPIAIQGRIAGSSSLSTVQLFDHTYSPIPLLNNATLSIGSHSAFTANVTYTDDLQNQQGVLLIQSPAQLLLTGMVFS